MSDGRYQWWTGGSERAYLASKVHTDLVATLTAHAVLRAALPARAVLVSGAVKSVIFSYWFQYTLQNVKRIML